MVEAWFMLMFFVGKDPEWTPVEKFWGNYGTPSSAVSRVRNPFRTEAECRDNIKFYIDAVKPINRRIGRAIACVPGFYVEGDPPDDTK